MKYILILLFIFILSLLETTIVPLNLTLITIIVLASLESPDSGLIFAFVSGIFVDLFKGKNLGLMSLLYLIIVIPIYFYKNRFHASKWQFVVIYTFIVVYIYNYFLGIFLWKVIIADCILVIIVLQLFKILMGREDSNKDKLKI